MSNNRLLSIAMYLTFALGFFLGREIFKGVEKNKSVETIVPCYEFCQEEK